MADLRAPRGVENRVGYKVCALSLRCDLIGTLFETAQLAIHWCSKSLPISSSTLRSMVTVRRATEHYLYKAASAAAVSGARTKETSRPKQAGRR
jgi:hypothetical protein